ncbi:MAG: filamentous hemagglutinin N-terminal protein [Herminiimonas sp.]|nr:filamentous hemagglutinin N-terminal protein [Herminiimonas sp.]
MNANAMDAAAGQTKKSSRQARRATQLVPGRTIKIRLGGRMMLLVWRTRARVAKLLQGMLARSMRHLAIGVVTGAAVLGGPIATAAPLAVNALPTGGAVVAGQAALSQTANSLNVVQTTKNAILNWNTFNIGSGATVNFQQPNTSSATLNRVITNDPSSLMGRLSANGKVWLINPAGIMVGKDARIDVAGFVASTLNVRDEDFLANRLNFSGGAGAGKVQNFGTITTPSGGSVYLVGAGVENQGVITAPGGEILLTAGHTVQLIDTGTPGVRVEITGSEGTATNLGQLLGEAGRIGMAGVLVKNAGVVDASSVSKEGGRIFLQATGSLVTEASSRLSADGTSGGKITLNAENSAAIDGLISAVGLSNHGGFVETSGKTQLSVTNAPSIGLGGEWLIDPNNITIQATGSPTNTTSGPAFSSTNDNSIVTTGLIETALNAGTNVTITTSSLGANTQAGNITIASPITKSDGLDATLTLSANNSIFVSQPITSTAGKLNLSLNANAAGGQSGLVSIASALDLNGGAMNIAGPLVLNRASLSGLQLNAEGLVTFAGDTSLNANVSLANAALSRGTLQGTGKLTVTNLNWSGGRIAGGTTSPAYDVTNLTLSGSESLDGRTLNLLSGGVSRATNAALGFSNGAVLNNAGTLTIADGTQLGSYSGGGNSAINNIGTVTSTNSSTSTTPTYFTTNSLGGTFSGLTTSFSNSGTVNVADGTLILGGSGTDTGAFIVSSNVRGTTSNLVFGNSYGDIGGRNINAGSTITGTSSNGGTAIVTFGSAYGDTTNLNTNVSLTNAAISGGTLQGTGKLTATNLNWSGGAIAGTATDPAYDITNLTLTGSTSLDGRTLNLLAGGNSRASSAYLTFKNSAVLNNAGALTVVDGTQLGNYYSPGAGSSAINNSGTVNSTGTYPTTNIVGAVYDALNFTAFNNTGTVNVTDGILQLGGGGTHTGAFNVSASGSGKTSTLGFGGNTYYYNGSAARTQNINAGATFTETATGGGRATVDLADGNGTTTNLNTNVSLANVALSGGTLQGTGKLTATNLDWSGGAIAGGADRPAFDVTNLTLSGVESLDGRTLNLMAGGASTATSAYLTFKNSAVLNNAGTLTVADNSQLGYYYSPIAGSSAFNNSGTVNATNKSTYWTTNSLGASYDALNFTAFNNTGAVNVVDGTLQLGGGGTHTGAFNVSASGAGKTSTLVFGGDTYNYSDSTIRTQNINAGATFTETANNGGVATVELNNRSGTTTNLNTDVSLASAALSNGTLRGTGKLTASNLKWSGGTIAGGEGSPAYDVTNLTLTGSETLDGRTLNLLAGGASKATSSYLTFKNSAVLNNAGALTVSDGTQLGVYYSASAGSSAINNSGTVNSTNTLAYATINTIGGNYDTTNFTAFNNTGTVNVADGTLQLSGGGTHTGAFNVIASTGGKTSTLSFGGNTYYYDSATRAQNINSGATITETGTNGGVATVAFSDYYYNNSPVNLNADVSLANVALSGGILQGTGKLTATNLNWSGGTIAGGAGSAAYDVTNLTLSGSSSLDGRTLNLLTGGASIASNAYLTFKNSAVLNNAGTLTIANGVQLGSAYTSGAGSSAINNSGTVNNINTSIYSTTNGLGGNYNASNFTAFNNTGTVNVTGGVLQVGSGSQIVNNGQIRIDTGATLSTAYRDLTNSASGVLSGNGTVNLGTTYTLINNGTVAPGTSAATGTLTVTGNYTQGSTGNLVARIGGGGPTQHDLLQVSGNTILDGTLTASALNNYVAVSGDAVTLIGGTPLTSTVSGTFAHVVAPANLNAGYGLYSGAPFRLTYAPGGSVFFNNADGDFSWSNPLNWSSRATPVSGNDVLINAGYTVQHASGNDAISSLTIDQNNGLAVSGGAISVSNLALVNGKLATSASGSVILNGGLSGSGLLAVDGGNVTLKGNSGIANLAMTSGAVTGDSDFTVSNSFAQTGGSLAFRTGAVDLRQNTGDLVISNLSAATASLQSLTGAILEGPGSANANALTTQSFRSVIVRETPTAITANSLTTRSVTGTRLDSDANAIGAFAATNSGSGNISVSTSGSVSLGQISDLSGTVTVNAGDAISQTGGIAAAALRTSSANGTRLDSTNAVASFSATNTVSGDVVLTNTTRPNTLSLAEVTNGGGGIVVDNTGAILTTGDITAAKGALSLTAHSPITVSSALVARDGITLNALPSSLATDTIAINGTMTSQTGSIALVAGTTALVGGSATLSVPTGEGISLSALGGAVSILAGATFVGATPTITQSLPTPVPPPVSAPPPVVTPAPTLTTLAPTPETTLLSTAPGTIPTTIDSMQKTLTPFGVTARDPALLSVIVAGGGNGSSGGYSLERQTIGGGVDSFGGVASTDKSPGELDSAGGATGKAPGTDTNRPAKSLPVCS